MSERLVLAARVDRVFEALGDPRAGQAIQIVLGALERSYEELFRPQGPSLRLPDAAAPDEDLTGEAPPSQWDPAPMEAVLSAANVRTLLTDVMRRAAHDWVLYRGHRKMELRTLAHEAFIWLFEEGPGHPWERMRKASGMELTSFLNICEVLDVDPDFARNKIRLLTMRDVKMAGRPPERRFRQSQDTTYYQEHDVEGTMTSEYNVSWTTPGA